MFVALIKHMEPEEKDKGINQAWLMTLNGLLDLGPKGEAAVRKEIRAIIDHGSWKVMRHTDMTPMQMREAISSFVFGKEKLTGETKARLARTASS